MKKQLTLLLIILLLIGLLVVAPLAYNHLKEKANTNAITSQTSDLSEYAAPDFTVYDKDGNAVQLSDFFGKPIVLNFWASWCGPCQNEMPYFDAVYQQYDGDVLFLMVNMTDGNRETVAKASGFIENYGYQFPVYYDTDMDAANTYGVYSLPTTYFISKDGILMTYAKGAITYEMLKQGVGFIHTEP